MKGTQPIALLLVLVILLIGCQHNSTSSTAVAEAGEQPTATSSSIPTAIPQNRLASVSTITSAQTLKTEDIICSVAFSPDGQIFAAGGRETILLWRTSNWSLLRTIKGHKDRIYSVAFSPDGQTLASGSWDKTIRLWRVSDGNLLRTLEVNTGRVHAVAFSPDGQILALGSDNATGLWRVADGELVRTLESEMYLGAKSVTFSPDGQTLAGGKKLWRVNEGTLLRNLNTISSDYVTFSPNGETLAICELGAEPDIELWRVSDGKKLFAFNSRSAKKYDLLGNTRAVFVPNGNLLISMGCGAGRDKGWESTIRVYRVSDGRLLLSQNIPKLDAVSLALSPDGRTLAAGGYIYNGGFQRSADEINVIMIWQIK